VILIRQANGGCGSARNAALDALPSDIEWIAFLDSDDRWKPLHISRALAALREGYDFVFVKVLHDFPLTSSQRGILRQRIAGNRQMFSLSVLGVLRGGRIPGLRMVARFFALDLSGIVPFFATGAMEVAGRLPLQRKKHAT